MESCLSSINGCVLKPVTMHRSAECDGEEGENKAYAEKEFPESDFTMSNKLQEKGAINPPAKMECILLKCPICREKYGEKHIPRNLVCGHSICTDCVEKCLAGLKLCPECREKQLVTKASELPINYPLLRFIRTITVDEFNISDEELRTIYPVNIPEVDPKQHVWNCGSHGSPVSLLCCTCSSWICQDCLVVDHPCLPRGSCRVLELSDAITCVKKEHAKVTEELIIAIEKEERVFMKYFALDDFCCKYCPGDLRHHNRLATKIKNLLKEFQEGNAALFQQANATVIKSIDSINKTSSPEDITTICKELLDYKEKFRSDIDKENDNTVLVRDIMLRHFKWDLKLLVERKQVIHARFEEDGKCMWGHVTLREDRMVMCSLDTEEPPKDSLTIPFEYVKKLISQPGYKYTIFFEVGTQDLSFGCVYVQFPESTVLVEQMVLMCIGQKGVSYKHSYFYKHDVSDGILYGGDYEKNNGTGGRAVVTGLGEASFPAQYRELTGYVVVNRISTRFQIHLKNLNKNVEGTIGKVVEGLSVLKKAVSSIDSSTNLVIRDCGVLIPMKNKLEMDEID